MIVPGRAGDPGSERHQPMAHAGDLPGCFVTGAVIADIVFGDESCFLLRRSSTTGDQRISSRDEGWDRCFCSGGISSRRCSGL